MPVSRRTVAAVLGILGGLGFIAWAVYRLRTGDVICIDHPMAPGDICDTTAGDLVHRSYAQLQASQHRGGMLGLVIGILMVAGGAALLWHRTPTQPRRLHRRRLVIVAVLAVFGLTFAGLGAVLLASDVRCGNRTMHTGDTCQVVDHGRVSVETYPSRHNEQVRYGVIALVGGLLVTGFCVHQWRKPDPSTLPPLPTA